MSTSILRLPDVKARSGLARSTIYRHVREGTFPPAVHLGARAVGWVESEIEDWLTARIEISRSNCVEA